MTNSDTLQPDFSLVESFFTTTLEGLKIRTWCSMVLLDVMVDR